MSDVRRQNAAVGTLGAILATTAAWWALALWPADGGTPEWVLRTRDVCFGADAESLPAPGGWLLLVGQPVGMCGLLVAIWGADLRAGLARLSAGLAGQALIGVVSAILTAGLIGTGVRISAAQGEPFPSATSDIAAALTRLNDAAPATSLIDQRGQSVSLIALQGRPVIVTFAFAHCPTVCPRVVGDALAARTLLGGAPAVVIVTLDPWRDTPSRLPAIADRWQLPEGTHVLSGAPDEVERALNRWRVPRTRNKKTGDILHPSLVYVLDSKGRIAYAVSGNAEVIAAAVRAL